MCIIFSVTTVSDVEFIRSLFTNEEYELYFAENNTSEDEWCYTANYSSAQKSD